MYTFKARGLSFLMLSAFLVFGMGYAFSSSAASNNRGNTTNANSLVARVVATNAGWDWIPRCANGAHWSKNDNRCKGGTDNKDKSNKHVKGYGTTNQAALVSRVNTVNAGWDWKPRCANGAHWSWNSNRCKGGSDND